MTDRGVPMSAPTTLSVPHTLEEVRDVVLRRFLAVDLMVAALVVVSLTVHAVTPESLLHRTAYLVPILFAAVAACLGPAQRRTASGWCPPWSPPGCRSPPRATWCGRSSTPPASRPPSRSTTRPGWPGSWPSPRRCGW